MTESQDRQAEESQGSNFYVSPDSAAVYKGYLLPGSNLVHAVIGQLKEQIANDPDLATKWEQDPRAVLASRGLGVSDYQTEILKAEGIPQPEMLCGETIVTICCVTVSS